MHLLIERVPSHWIVEFATSSSRDEVKYTRAGTLSFISEPGAQAKANLESLDKKNAVETTQASRREGLRRHIRRFLSYLTLSDFRPPRSLDRYPTDPPKMVYGDQYDSFAPDSSYWTNISGTPGGAPSGADYPKEMSACNDVRELPYYGRYAPQEMHAGPVSELYGDEQMPAKVPLSLDTAPSFMNPTFTAAPAPDAHALPQLSPQTTPTRDSPVSSLTPSTIQSAITPPQFGGDVLDQTVSPDGVTVYQKSQYDIQLAQLQAMQTMQTMENDFYSAGLASTKPFPDTTETLSFTSGRYSEARHMDSNTIHALQEYPSVMQPLQRASTMPSSNGSRRQLTDFGSRGTFGFDNTAAAAGRYTHDERSPSTRETPSDEMSFDAGVRDIAHVRSDCREWDEKTAVVTQVAPPAKVYKPVKCLECRKEFTGKWGSGNMRRHSKHSHRTTLEHTERLTCHACGITYKRSDALRNHRCQGS